MRTLMHSAAGMFFMISFAGFVGGEEKDPWLEQGQALTLTEGKKSITLDGCTVSARITDEEAGTVMTLKVKNETDKEVSLKIPLREYTLDFERMGRAMSERIEARKSSEQLLKITVIAGGEMTQNVTLKEKSADRIATSVFYTVNDKKLAGDLFYAPPQKTATPLAEGASKRLQKDAVVSVR